ncbi:hypothetical protein ACFQ3N_02055 [Virgibacillus byunsanensis]|uniref:Uncharacterized protein n=1 Tax=Virgibacillus byunsanensis TaxID=570945 RepID=A0ABW3LFN1_9BACI
MHKKRRSHKSRKSFKQKLLHLIGLSLIFLMAIGIGYFLYLLIKQKEL